MVNRVGQYLAFWYTFFAVACLSSLGLRPLRAIFGTLLTTTFDAMAVHGPANDVVPHSRKVLDTAAANHDLRVFLQVMPYAQEYKR